MTLKYNVCRRGPEVSVFVRAAPMIIVMGAIFYLSHQPAEQLDLPDIPYIDKVGHFLLYAALALTILYVPSRRLRLTRPELVAGAAFVMCVLYGISDEFHQSFIPGRFAGLDDVIADACGAFSVCLFWLAAQHRRNRKDGRTG